MITEDQDRPQGDPPGRPGHEYLKRQQLAPDSSRSHEGLSDRLANDHDARPCEERCDSQDDQQAEGGEPAVTEDRVRVPEDLDEDPDGNAQNDACRPYGDDLLA
ncbi:hypothetical protein [Streptomyces sp. JV178]|uniref:hypothetical protein n=1 Tax=Streptomyces sp. JV178 TaxID=858632 RepID=UPI00117CF2B7|nr:hypothetical protein [Streptomyces sp. JV178]